MNQLRPVLIGMPVLFEKSQHQKPLAHNALDWGVVPKSVDRLQLAALVAGFASVVSFLYLAAAVGNFNEQVNRVVIADKVAVICLVVGAVAYVMNRLIADQI